MVAHLRNHAVYAGIACLMLPLLAAGQPATADVTAVRIDGNTLLPEQTLARLTDGVVGHPLSLDRLKATAARIQGAYRDAGYGGVIAYVPPQESGDGTVVIKVLEGKVAQVSISGNAHYTTGNIRAGLVHLHEGTTPLVRAIDRDIQLTNDNPRKHVNVVLAAGERPGDIDARVNVTDAPPVQYLVGFNNTGTRMTGRNRLSVGIEHANLFGSDQVGTLQYQTSPDYPGRVRIYSGGYRIPLYAHAASLDAFAAYSSVSNGTTATVAGPLSFTGRGTILGLHGNLHLDRRGEYDQSVTLGLEHRSYRDDCSIGEFGAAGCGAAAVAVTTEPLSLSYTGQKSGPALSYGFNAGLTMNIAGSTAATFEASRPGAKRRYAMARLSGFVEKPLAGQVVVLARVEMQYSPDRLVAAERFGIGGAGSVRGYSERELNGDNGILVRLEAAAATIDAVRGVPARLYVLLDHGRVRNHADLPCRGARTMSCNLTGAGVGARLTLPRRASATLELARAMDAGTTTERGDIRAHVALNLAF